ncbi:putative urea ABC transporter substrate-binding protein [candidate division KSB1 bacterium]
MSRLVRTFILIMLALVIIINLSTDDIYAQKPKVRIAWSIYVGWMPWDYADAQGILKSWGDRYGVEIELLPRMDYIASIEAYVAKQVDACVMTNMEALDMPAASGITSTALIIGDYSNGNDAVLTRDNINIDNIKGHEVYLAELSVSHYLLDRYLKSKGLSERDVKLMNTSDSDIAPIFIGNKDIKVVVTWNPMVMEIMKTPGVTNVYNSSKTPGEILDLMVISTDLLEKNPDIGRALVGAWYEVMDIMSKRGSATDEALEYMGAEAEASLVEYKNQLKTTMMFWTSQSAADYAKSKEIKEKMDYVRNFCFDHGLLGENAPSVDIVGIKYPDGTIQGNSRNVQFTFDAKFMQEHADGKIKK